MAASLRIPAVSPRMRPAAGASAAPSAARVLAESALAILLRRRNCGEPAWRLAGRALARRWVAVARGAS